MTRQTRDRPIYQVSARRQTEFSRTAASIREPPEMAAEAAGLVYVTDAEPGIRRVRAGRNFRYVNARAEPVGEQASLERIRSLSIPPAWENVWICANPQGHLQATGRDARGRKQHRYHPEFRAWRDQAKYDEMLVFVEALPSLRRHVSRDLRRSGLCREKVTAAVVRLLQDTLIRVGNEEYVKQNGSYGLTTLRDRHARIAGGRVRFQFLGKSGVKHCIDLCDKRLARIVKACQDLPGQVLFQYVDGKEIRSIGSADVNAYLRELTGMEFTAKDFRTWAGTVLAACALCRCGRYDSVAEGKRNVNAAIAEVARLLGNTRAVCRKCYVHPRIIECYQDGTLVAKLKLPPPTAALGTHGGLSSAERAVLRFLKANARE